MKTILDSYIHLLTDVSQLSKVPLATPDNLTMSWILSEGPELDKQLLKYLEHGDEPAFPDWLLPLWTEFKDSKEPLLLRYIRQLLLFGYKAMLEPNDSQLKEAQASFIETDSSIGIWDQWFSTAHKALFASARAYIGRVIYKCKWSEILPSHGPGAVYPPSRPSMKGKFSTIYEQIQRKYPFYEYFEGLANYWPDPSSCSRFDIAEETSIVANLVAVPKDSRGPRLICVHPKEAIWIQQGQRRILERAIQNHPSTSGRISFRDQTVNSRLALSASISREYCTLDLKDASDRVSDTLVRFLFGGAYDWIGCARATHVRLFDNVTIALNKFAPMGNALTFPVESLLFWAMVKAGIRSRHGVNCDEVYVFGDDLLFPSKYYDGAVYGLMSAGLVVNTSKTFRHGFFRESCGVDAFNGVDVTPHRLKKWQTVSATNLISICALARNLRIDGFENTASYLYSRVAKVFGILPLSNNPYASGIYEYVQRDFGYLLRYERSTRFNRRYHTWQVSMYSGRPKVDSYHDARWHLQESILRLARQEQDSEITSGGLKGLVYSFPRRVSLHKGCSDILMGLVTPSDDLRSLLRLTT